MEYTVQIPEAAQAVRAEPGEECVLVLQGGGALGAYQAGVFEALATAYREPTWVAGISIGAINAALIVGNPPELRVARLREFWELVSSSMPGTSPAFAPPTFGHALSPAREALNEASASQALLFGVPGFFKPRFPPAPLQPPPLPQPSPEPGTCSRRAHRR